MTERQKRIDRRVKDENDYAAVTERIVQREAGRQKEEASVAGTKASVAGTKASDARRKLPRTRAPEGLGRAPEGLVGVSGYQDARAEGWDLRVV
ncbi:hypothetical protein [Sorangium sp. So ce1182]|uniref:hypothetical protein n=1 Tax=Sorangium sp. So ce1182 TaxID=3133334 RepID=UPI003F5FB3F9